jgi:hypothetical protein
VNCDQELCIELWSVINFHCEIEPAKLLQYCSWLLREYYYLNFVDMPIVVYAVSGGQLAHERKLQNFLSSAIARSSTFRCRIWTSREVFACLLIYYETGQCIKIMAVRCLRLDVGGTDISPRRTKTYATNFSIYR